MGMVCSHALQSMQAAITVVLVRPRLVLVVVPREATPQEGQRHAQSVLQVS